MIVSGMDSGTVSVRIARRQRVLILITYRPTSRMMIAKRNIDFVLSLNRAACIHWLHEGITGATFYCQLFPIESSIHGRKLTGLIISTRESDFNRTSALNIYVFTALLI
jgi:hypothetical protein